MIPLTLSIFNDPYEWDDVAIIAAGTGVATLVPAIGWPFSLLVLIGLLHWRISADWVPDLTVAVVASRLATIPALMLLSP
ncbi:hypothetical protein H0E84_06985 [Luteimonas sp. SJ-92]|uniref:Uncharacterized protein n=1 Tax=Luteimonas salinisoli TaxID=2752307 RepID=A0A853JA81_9GAMM|nr:hypothetical protein [Luteimonas salinisoli]NZA26126.1 hypothetical protein [Luteimonas salinisoli]